MKIALLAPLISRHATGLSTYVSTLSRELMASGHEVTILATDIGVEKSGMPEFVSGVDLHLFNVDTRLNRKLYRCPALLDWLNEHIEAFDVLDIQGMWTSVGAQATQLANSRRIPVVITPHGMMTTYDWSKHPIMKAIAYELFFKNQWRSASGIRYLSEGEKTLSKKDNGKFSIVIPNAVEPAQNVASEHLIRVRTELGLADTARVVLFVGRVCHQKGVADAIDAFSNCIGLNPEDSFLIAGPLDDSYRPMLETAIKHSPRKSQIRILGPIFGPRKFDLLRIADLFITLSRNEGLSFAALEALAYGLPVILTEDSNLPLVTKYEAGYIVPINVPLVSKAIDEALAPGATGTLRSGAQRLYREHFAWEKVLPRLISFYEEVLSRSAQTGK